MGFFIYKKYWFLRIFKRLGFLLCDIFIVMKKVVRLTESDLTRIVKRVIEDKKTIKEDFNPMVGIDHFLNNPVMMVLATTWVLQGKLKLKNISSNLKGAKQDFISYCNSMGYTIDNEILDIKFKQLINKITDILGL